MRKMLSDNSVKMMCVMILILASWGGFLFCVTTHVDKEILEGVGFVAGMLTVMNQAKRISGMASSMRRHDMDGAQSSFSSGIVSFILLGVCHHSQRLAFCRRSADPPLRQLKHS